MNIGLSAKKPSVFLMNFNVAPLWSHHKNSYGIKMMPWERKLGMLADARRFTRNDFGAVRTAIISSRFVRYLTTSKGQIVHWTVCSFFVCRNAEHQYHFLPEAIAAFSIPASVSLARANRKTTYFPIARRADPTLNAISAMEKYGKFRKVASHICTGRSLWALPKLARWASPPWNPQRGLSDLCTPEPTT